jgi:hypothetical protein
MELFLPGLFVLLISALFIFLVVPRVGSLALAVISIITLIAVISNHAYMFKDEYRLSTWQNQLGSYAPFAVLGVAIIVILLVAVNMFTGKVMETIKAPVEILQTSVQNAVSSMPSAASATNYVTSNINKAMNSPKSLIPALGYKASNV